MAQTPIYQYPFSQQTEAQQKRLEQQRQQRPQQQQWQNRDDSPYGRLAQQAPQQAPQPRLFSQLPPSYQQERPILNHYNQPQQQDNIRQTQQESIYGNAQQRNNPTPNTFTCDHLATFTLPTEARIEARDGLERLKAMEKSTGIWKMRVRLTVKTGMLRVSDINTGNLIEEFPMDVVKDLKCFQEPTNLIMFTIFDGSINELHMFQCLVKSGRDFVKEMERAKQLSSLKIEPVQMPPNQPEAYPIFPADLIDPSSKKVMKSKFQTVRGEIPQAVEPKDAVDRQVKILDCLFSDIESFITNLHQVAYAYQAKAKRKTVRNSGFGDGLQNMRCKQLQAKEFVDILMEFKLSFILIAKLKKIICNPNAPELVHYLFKPLSLIVHTTIDSNDLSGIDLARTVVNPLISLEVINLFENCLNTTETNLWNELGDSWKKTDSEWHEDVPLYVPIFKNGWRPPLDWMKEILDVGSPMNKKSIQQLQPTTIPSPSPPASPISTSSSSSGNTSLNDKFLKKLIKEKGKVYTAVKPYIGKNEKELTISTGDILEVLKDTKNWWKLRNCRGLEGFAPRTFLEPYI